MRKNNFHENVHMKKYMSKEVQEIHFIPLFPSVVCVWVCRCVFVYVYACVNAHACMCTCLCRPEVDIIYPFYFLRQGLSVTPSAHPEDNSF